MAACMTVFPVLTLLLSVSISGGADRPQCVELVDDPHALFAHSKIHTDPIAEYLVTDLAECMSMCCYEELSCNVGVFTDSSSSDTNCWLYTCHPLDSCSIKTRKRAQTFVDPHSADVEGPYTSANTEHSTPAYEHNTVDDGNNVDNTDYTAPQDDNETYYTDEGTGDAPPIPESTIISSSSTTSEVTGNYAPPSTSESTGNSTPPTTSEPTDNYTPPSTSESTENSIPPSTSESTENSTPPSTSEATEHSTPPSTPESTENSIPPSTSDFTGNYIPPSTSESTVMSTPPSTSDLSRVEASEMSRVADLVLSTVTALELVPEETPIWSVSENNTFMSLVNKSAIENDTLTTPGNGDILINDTVPTSFNQTSWENDTNTANVSEEIKGNNTLMSLFTKENDTANENDNPTASAENKYNVNNDTAWLADQLASNESSLSLSPSETELLQTLDTLDQAYYSIRSSLLSEDSAVIRPANTTSYSSLLAEVSLLSSSEWSTLEVESTTYLPALDGLVSSDLSGSVVALGTGVDVSSSLGIVEDGGTDWPGYTQTSRIPRQSATVTPDVPPPVNVLPQDPQDDTETRADISYQPSETATGLLISALAVGCVCALTVVGVLSLRLYDGYKKRHYSRLDYLINGMYN